MTNRRLKAFQAFATVTVPEINLSLKSWDHAVLTAAETDSAYDEYATSHLDAFELAQMTIRARQRRAAIQTETSEVDDQHLSQWVWAKSLVAATHAEADGLVAGFRADALQDRLLRLDQVARWVKRRQKLDGPATAYVRVPISRGWKPGDPIVTDPRSVDVSTDRLDYAIAGGEGVHRVAVAANGVLGRLRAISVHLANLYAWQPAQATTFVLTGATPIVSTLRTTTTYSTSGNRVKVDADPDLPAEQVIAAYMDARSAVLGPRARRPSERGVKLVIHATERPGMSMRALMRQWNDTVATDDRYSDVRLFRQALRDAQRRVGGVPRKSRRAA